MTQVLKARQKLYQTIRSYFAVKAVLEVETPIRSVFGNTDPAIESILAQNGEENGWLRTSPEFFHKRLLATGVGDLFEIAKVFRASEVSSRHRPEFTMLEYYRLSFDEFDLMRDLASLLQQCFAAFHRLAPQIKFVSYRDWFQAGLRIDPITADDEVLRAAAQSFGAMSQLDRDGCLDFLRSHVLEPKLDGDTLFFVHDFPASQAALAQLNVDGKTARRFELFCNRLELANGYFELSDAHEQGRRFAADNAKRIARGQIAMPIDQALLGALSQGLPSCAGVAVGLDRVLMLLLDVRDIADVLAFPHG
jgi:elongation factor P--(R)-beta-lysine ligase